MNPNQTDPRPQDDVSSHGLGATSLTAYPLISLTDGIVLPDMVITVTVSTPEARAASKAAHPSNGGNDQLILAPQGASIGVLATIENRHDDTLTLRAQHRVRLGAAVAARQAEPDGETLPIETLLIEAHAVDEQLDAPEVADRTRTYRALAETLLTRVGGRRMAMILRELTSPSALADSIAYWPELSFEQRLKILETPAVADRLALGIDWLREALAEIDVREQIASEVTSNLDDTQRKHILRRQLAAIRKELGDDSSGAATDYRARLESLDVPDKTRAAILEEIERLERTSEESMEASWVRTWLDVTLGLPWNERTEDNLDLTDARATLDRDHTGIVDVKDRLIEFLAVRKLRHERGLTADKRAGVLLALVGPPGVGKTSLGESVAASARSIVRPGRPRRHPR